jgi:hypothetical protein
MRSSRNPMVALISFLIVIALGYEAAQAIIAGDSAVLSYTALVFVGGAVFVAILNDWRRGLYLLVVWILFEDFVRKYLGNNMAIYFAKDLLALILYLSFFRSRVGKQVERFKLPFRVAFIVFFWFCILQMFNDASPSVLYGVLGIKVNFLYAPLVFVGYAISESEADLQQLLSFLCILILIVAGLGLAQSILGPTFLNPRVLQDDIRDLATTYRAAPISGLLAYRPTSVFVSAGRFQDFLIFAWLICLGYSGYLLLRTRQGRTLAFCTIGVVAAASIMSASRGVFMWNAGSTLVFIAGFLWGAPWRQREALRVFRAIQRTCLLIGIGVIGLLTIFPQELGSRIAIYSETLMPDSPASELLDRTHTYPLRQLELAFEHPRWPYGYGLGTTTLGRQYLIRLLDVPPLTVGVENGFGNVLIETGIVGLILFVFFGASVVFSTWKVVLKLRGSPWFPIGFVIFLFAALIFFPMCYAGTSTYQDFVINSNLWLLLGILFRLKSYPAALQMASAQAAAQASRVPRRWFSLSRYETWHRNLR